MSVGYLLDEHVGATCLQQVSRWTNQRVGDLWGGSEGWELGRGARQQRGWYLRDQVCKGMCKSQKAVNPEWGVCVWVCAFTNDLLSLLAEKQKGTWVFAFILCKSCMWALLKAAPWL